MHFLFVIMFFYQVIPNYSSHCNLQLRVNGSRGQHLVGLQKFTLLLLIFFYNYYSEIIPGPAASKLLPVFLGLRLGLRHYLSMSIVNVK